MDAKELASKLNGRQYREEMTSEEEGQARVAGLVVIFGASDDLMEIRGVVSDEVGAYGGGTAYFTPEGLLYNECGKEECPYFAKLQAAAASVTAVWDSEGYSWVYETDIPHETFEIMEDEEKYCRGIVFSLAVLRSACEGKE